MKRKLESSLENCNKVRIIDSDFVNNCKKEFDGTTQNLIIKNAITNVGSLHVTTDNNEARKVSHVFLNSIKNKKIKATDQGGSGRCWIFSGLNMFRHSVINGLNLENFEFSETYLFFWDKFERSNTLLHMFDEYLKNNENLNPNDNFFKYITHKEQWMSDGGYWNYFSNLVSKYGLIPKSAMPETVHSEYSSDMNTILNKDEQIKNIIDKTLRQIYTTLVKFLGEPPKTFNWSFATEENEMNIIENLDSDGFKQMVLPGINVEDFIVLVNIPGKKLPYYKKYMIKNTNNIIEKDCFTLINLPIEELKKYSKKSILAGMPVWFGADVNKGFNPLYSSLDDNINKNDLVFGERFKINKENRLLFSNQETCHAMTLIGINIDNRDKPINWQVENSWGFYDNEELGQDGFLSMTDKWFEEYVGQVVIHKEFLSRKILNINKMEPVKIEAWESVTPALKINSKRFYKYDYVNIVRNKK
jgi:bleomycin hydrolase